MGNQNSLINETVIEVEGKLEDQLQCLGTKQHKYLGQIQLWRKDSKSNPTIFSKQSHSGQRHDHNINEHNDRKKVSHPNVLQYYGCSSNYLTFKGNIQQTKFFFEYIPNTLDNVIKFHKNNCSYLEESEIWKITMQVISACSFLQKLDLFHGDLNPQSIFIDSNKCVKILYHNAYPELITSYAKLLAFQECNVYISPQQLTSLAQQSVTPNDDPLKTDSFQLGLTLLELMTMTSILEDCIDYTRKTIYFKSIMDLLASARKRYSQALINLIKRLLTFDQESRPTLTDILFDTNLQQGAQYVPQTRILRGNTSPPKQPQRTNSPPPDMGLSSKSPAMRDFSAHSYIRSPLQRSVSPILDRSFKYLSPNQQSKITTNVSPMSRATGAMTVIIPTHTPNKNDRGRKLNTVNDSRNVMMLSRSPIDPSRKTSFYQIQPKLQLQVPLLNQKPIIQQSQYQDFQNQQKRFSQTLQQFVRPYINVNQDNLSATTKKHDIQQQQQPQSLEQQSQNNPPANTNNQKTPQKVHQKGINLLSPLHNTNKIQQV